MLNEDEVFYNSPEVLESVEEAERRYFRRMRRGAAAVMFDSDEEDFTSSFNFALRF